MEYWIDRSGSEHQNVIALTENAILVGSCEEKHLDQMDSQLRDTANPIEVLGTENIVSIPLTQVQSLVSRSTDSDVDVKYKTRKDVEEITLDFETAEEGDRFVSAIDAVLPEDLHKDEYQQSALMAIMAPLLSVLLGAAVLYVFYNKLRVIAMIVGGIWIAGSLYMLFMRSSNPPKITRWGVKGGYVGKTWQGLKTAFSLFITAAVVIVFASRFPDSHGPANIYENLENGNTITAERVDELLAQGGDVNFRRGEETVLASSLYWENDIVSTKLIEAGADVNTPVDGTNMLEMAISNDAGLPVIKLILDRINKSQTTVYDMSLKEFVEYSNEEDDTELAAVIASYL